MQFTRMKCLFGGIQEAIARYPGGRIAFSQLTIPARPQHWRDLWLINPYAMANGWIGGCDMAVPLEDTYLSTEVPIPELGASIRYTFVLSCNDAFKFRMMDDKRRKAFDSFRAMPNLPQAQRLNLGKTSSFPTSRWCSRYPSDQPDCLNRRCP